jgi:hypothetical protein
MPLRRGAPKGNQNRLKHGRYSAATVARRKQLRETIRGVMLALMAAKVALLSEPIRLDKST